MKRSWMVGLVSLVFLPVVPAQADRSVQKNLFVSTTPQLEVLVTPPFRNIGEAQFATATLSGNQTQAKAYVFIDNVQDQVKRIFFIKLIPELIVFPGNLLGNLSADLSFGTCILADRQYQCTAKLTSFTGDEPVVKFISPQGYFLPPCLLMKSFVTTDSTKGNYLIGIFYLEAVSQSVFDCRSWQSTSQPSSSQQDYLAQFEQNCLNAFDVYPRKFSEVPGFPRLYETGNAPLVSGPSK